MGNAVQNPVVIGGASVNISKPVGDAVLIRAGKTAPAVVMYRIDGDNLVGLDPNGSWIQVAPLNGSSARNVLIELEKKHQAQVNSTTAKGIKPLKTVIDVPTINKRGEYMPNRERHIRNTPLSILFPDEPVVTIDWQALDGKKPTLEELVSPIRYDGKRFFGSYLWGSAVKRGQTFGFTRDIGRDCGIFRINEDAYRGGAWLMSEGHFGGFYGDKLNIAMFDAGTILPFGQIGDGFGFIRRSLSEMGFNKRSTKISLGDVRESYMFWQRFQWTPEFEEEVASCLAKTREEYGSPDEVHLTAAYHLRDDIKRMLTAKNKLMAVHPHVVNAVSRNRKELFSRLCTTVQMNSQIRVAVPTPCPVAALPPNHVFYRHPVQEFSLIQRTKEGDCDPALLKKEMERIANLEVIQYRLSSHSVSFKGCLGVIDDAFFPKGIDMIVCRDDQKMPYKWEHKDANVVSLNGPIVCTFTNWYGKGAAVGMNEKFVKDKMGEDFDGDMNVVFDASDKPEILRQIDAFPETESKKIHKTYKSFTGKRGDVRAEIALTSMYANIGAASNLMSYTFGFKNRMDEVIRKLGYSNREDLDSRLNHFYQVMTDIFKIHMPLEEMKKIMTQMETLKKNLLVAMGSFPKYIKWSKDEWSFEIGFPPVGVPSQETEWTEDQKRYALDPKFDSVPAEIAKIMLPYFEEIFPHIGIARPLSYFCNWAPEVKNDKINGEVNILQIQFNTEVKTVNWSYQDEARSFCERFIDKVDAAIERVGCERIEFAYALWRRAHAVRGPRAGGASVFIGMIDEAIEIVSEMPGLKAMEFNLQVTGIHKAFPENFKLDKLELHNVHLAEFEEEKKGVRFKRQCLVAEVEGQIQPTDPKYPANTIGVVSERDGMGEFGGYDNCLITRRRPGANAWDVVLSGYDFANAACEDDSSEE